MGSAIGLSLMPCPFNLVKPCIGEVEKVGRVTGLVVFTSAAAVLELPPGLCNTTNVPPGL